jgi:hypothetical protein
MHKYAAHHDKPHPMLHGHLDHHGHHGHHISHAKAVSMGHEAHEPSHLHSRGEISRSARQGLKEVEGHMGHDHHHKMAKHHMKEHHKHLKALHHLAKAVHHHRAK